MSSNFDIGISDITSREIYCTELTDELIKQILGDEEWNRTIIDGNEAQNSKEKENTISEEICGKEARKRILWIVVNTNTEKEFFEKKSEKFYPKKYKDRKKQTTYDLAAKIGMLIKKEGASLNWKDMNGREREYLEEIMRLDPDMIKKCIQTGREFEKRYLMTQGG
ncbi:MAG: hypothetical protein WBA22_10065 [Candidatus Methanofastidiosia archaeon]